MFSRTRRAALAAAAAAIAVPFTIAPAVHAEPSSPYETARPVDSSAPNLQARRGYVSSPQAGRPCAQRAASAAGTPNTSRRV
jgi:hypothetical protein